MTVIRELKLQACGQWAGIVSNSAPHLLPAIERRGKHCACPIHGGKDGFRVFKDFDETGGGVCNTCGKFADGLTLLQWANDWSFKETLAAVKQYLSNAPHKPTTYKHASIIVVSKPNLRRQQKIDEVLSQASDLSGAAKTYLANRGLHWPYSGSPNDLKFIESLPYWHDGKQLGAFPTLLGVVKNLAGEIVTLHRTYLNHQGYKANVPTPKKLLPPALPGTCAGASIQLYKPTTQLAIAEGIETALAVHLATGFPVWAAISTTMLEKVQIPSSVQEVYIMSDKDLSGAGRRSATRLAKRLIDHHIVRIVEPHPPIPKGSKSLDWLDMYQRETGTNIESFQFKGDTA